MNEENLPLIDKQEETQGYIELLQLHKSFIEVDQPSQTIRSKFISNPFMVPIIFLILISLMMIVMQMTGYFDATIIFN